MLKVDVLDISYCRQLTSGSATHDLDELKEEFNYVFVVSYEPFEHPDYEVINKHSAVIPLDTNLDEILTRFHATCRNEVRRSYKEEEMEFTSSIEDWDEFYAFHKRCEQERGWIPVPLEELQQSLCFAVKYKGHYMAGMSCYSSEKFMRIGRIFSRRRADEFVEAPGVLFSAASRRIVYEFCNWGIENGKQHLDLGGIDPDDQNKGGITKFKMYFGSEIYPTFLGRYSDDLFESKREEFKQKQLDIT